MKFSTYLDYTSRSLLRGGQRTLLAIFCVAVGVTAVVSLQLVGLMLHNTLTADVRDSNGGDIAVTSFGTPFKQSDLAFFSQLKANGTITNDTAVIAASGTLSATASSAQAFTIVAVDPNNYPLVSPPAFVTPGNGSVAHLLLDNQVIVTQSFLDRYQLKPGTAFTVYMKTNTGVGQALTVQIAGVIANTGTFAQAGNLLLISTHDYLAAAPPS